MLITPSKKIYVELFLAYELTRHIKIGKNFLKLLFHQLDYLHDHEIKSRCVSASLHEAFRRFFGCFFGLWISLEQCAEKLVVDLRSSLRKLCITITFKIICNKCYKPFIFVGCFRLKPDVTRSNIAMF